MLQAFKETLAARQPMNSVPKLGTWIAKQRRDYKAYKEKSPNVTMTADTVTRLTAAGFIFHPKKQVSWDELASQWFEYCTKYRRKPSSTSRVGKWAIEQRLKYKERKEGKTNELTEERINQLTEWGFKWDIRKTVNAADVKSWDEQFQELVEYKEAHGHTAPPCSLEGLGPWTSNQRCQYRKYLNGEKTSLTEDRVAKLRKIEFGIWACKSRPKKRKREHHESDSDSEEEPEEEDDEEDNEETDEDDEEKEETDEENELDHGTLLSDDSKQPVEKGKRPDQKRRRSSQNEQSVTGTFSFIL